MLSREWALEVTTYVLELRGSWGWDWSRQLAKPRWTNGDVAASEVGVSQSIGTITTDESHEDTREASALLLLYCHSSYWAEE